MDTALIVSSFIAGLLTFLAPCTFPLVPAYLALLSGAAPRDMQNPEIVRKIRRSIASVGVFFILGFTCVFIALGMIAGLAGSVLGEHRVWLERASGVFVILFGLFMLGVVRIPFLSKEQRINPSPFLKYGRKANAFIMGSAFALGWTPCIGPVLGTILLLASNAGTAAQGILLLSVFSLGLALPFLAIAFFIGSAARAISRMAVLTRAISWVGGTFLVMLGILLLSGTTGYFISAAFRLFQFINYDKLLNYL